MVSSPPGGTSARARIRRRPTVTPPTRSSWVSPPAASAFHLTEPEPASGIDLGGDVD